MNEILEQTRDALFKIFGAGISDDPTEAKKLIEQHTHLPEDDSGQWAPRSAAVIHAECIPLPSPEEIPAIEAWCRVSDLLDGHFCEHINGAVVAVYED